MIFWNIHSKVVVRSVVLSAFFFFFMLFSPSLAFAGDPFPTHGNSCDGRLTWRLVNADNEEVERASQASLLNVCISGFPTAESVTELPTTGYTFEVSWAQLYPFRQVYPTGVTVFYQANPPDVTGSDGNFTACNWYGVAGWAHDEYCPGFLNQCMNNFVITCNDIATRYWVSNTEAVPVEEYDPLPDYAFCAQVPLGDQRTACESCLQSGGGTSDEAGYTPKDTLYTAVGCINISKTGLARDLIRLGLGIGGGLSLLSILAGGFMFTTSQGDASKLKEAKNLITASVAGLFFMIFSTIILNFIGVEIFRIPGLGS